MVRRTLAALLLVLFSLPLIAPALASSSADAGLPACCRRDGKHHCADGMALAVPSKYAVASEKCCFPVLPQALLMLPHAFTADAVSSAALPLSTPEAVAREAESARRISRERSRHKRGPPALLAI